MTDDPKTALVDALDPSRQQEKFLPLRSAVEVRNALPPEGPGVFLGFDAEGRPWLLKWETTWAFGARREPGWVALGYDRRDYPAVFPLAEETNEAGEPSPKIVAWRALHEGRPA